MRAGARVDPGGALALGLDLLQLGRARALMVLPVVLASAQPARRAPEHLVRRARLHRERARCARSPLPCGPALAPAPPRLPRLSRSH